MSLGRERPASWKYCLALVYIPGNRRDSRTRSFCRLLAADLDFTSEVGFETANESSAGKVADVVGKSVGGAGEGDVKSLGATAIAGESGDEESFEDRDDEDNREESNA